MINNEPVKLILPLKFIEPVLTVFVIINSSTEGPNEPDTDMNALPSVVFNAISPNCKFEFVGFWPATALLRSFTICAISMDPYVLFCGIYHG